MEANANRFASDDADNADVAPNPATPPIAAHPPNTSAATPTAKAAQPAAAPAELPQVSMNQLPTAEAAPLKPKGSVGFPPAKL